MEWLIELCKTETDGMASSYTQFLFIRSCKTEAQRDQDAGLQKHLVALAPKPDNAEKCICGSTIPEGSIVGDGS